MLYSNRMQLAVLRDIFKDIAFFPVWWYSRGLIVFGQYCLGTLKSYTRYLAVGVWIRHIFVPMFGQNDWQSRIISVFMRSVQIVGRSFLLAIMAGGTLVVGGLYLGVPLIVALLAAYHLLGSLLYAF